MLKNDINIEKAKTSSFKLVLAILENELTGKKPPDEINVNDKFKDINDLNSKILKIKNKITVSTVYIKKIFIDCFTVSEVLKDKKFVNDFFKLSSNISISSTIEKRKYNPPIHCVVDLQIISDSS